MSAFFAHVKTAFEQVRTLKDSPRELWLAYTNMVFCSFADYGLSVIFVIFLKSLDFSDQTAGTLYGVFGALVSLYGFIVGFVVDNIGVKWALVIGVTIQAASKLGLAFVTSKGPSLYIVLFFFVPLGEAMAIPVINTSLRRYTILQQRAFAYGLLYAFMNFGAIGSGWGIDIARKVVGEGIQSGPYFFNPVRVMLLALGVALLIPLVTTLFLVREISLNEEGVASKFEVKREAPWTIVREVAFTKNFWKYVLLAVLLANVRGVFRHVEATMPTYMIRAFGEDAPYGLVIAINPMIVVVLTPFMQFLTGRYRALIIIVIGAWISALSPGWAGIGNGIAFCVLFVVQLSIGESLWSPRTMGYAMSVAPKGREGTFSAIASIPLFLSRVPAGVMSGYLLTKYCPEDGDCNGRTLWLIVMAIALIAPLLISILFKVIYDPLADKPPGVADAQSNEYILLEEVEEAAKITEVKPEEVDGAESGHEKQK